jgi:hypothetical protein
MHGQRGEGVGQPPLSSDNEVSGADDRGRTNRVDFRELYAQGSRETRSNRSISSFTTEWSNATDPVSNATESRVEKKKQKRRFLVFTKILMKFLERRDPSVHSKAQHVIRDCDEKKKLQHPGYESLTESVRTPLKEVVGPSYWKQARGYLKKAVAQLPPEEIEPLPPSEDPPTFSPSDLAYLEQSFLTPEQAEARDTSLPTVHSPFDQEQAEKKLRRQRFWMLIRVLMRYLEQKDHGMYIKAKETIQDCVKRNRRREHGYRSLTKEIRVSLKEVVGDDYWRRAEAYLGHILAEKADEEEYAAERRELRRCRRRQKIVKAHLACLREGNNGVMGDMGDEPQTGFVDLGGIQSEQDIFDPPALTHCVEDLLVHDQVDGLDPTWDPANPVDDADSRRSQQRATWPAIPGQNEVPVSYRYSSQKRPFLNVESCRKVELPSESLRLGALHTSGGADSNHPGTSHSLLSTDILGSSRPSHVSLALEEAADGQDCRGPRKRLRLGGSFSSIARPPIERLEKMFEPPS